MVVSYTIRQEQDTSAQTAPYIEDLVQQIIDAHDGITDQEFFQILFHQPVNSPFQMFLDTNDAQYFHEYVENLIDSDMISGLQIYMDFPPQSVRLFSDDLTKDYFSPMSKARGTYWYGIFQGTQQSSLFCPAFYLGEREEKKIRRSCIYYFHDLLLSGKSPSGLHRPLQFFRLSLRYVER